MTFVNERPKGTQIDEWRTIDHDRNAVLKMEKGLPHGGGSWFRLRWDGETILFGAYERLNGYIDEGNPNLGAIKVFSIFQLGIPTMLKDNVNEIKSIITEALSEYRVHYRYADIAQVQVDFSKCQISSISGDQR